ncbi:hypothetical protein Tco_0199644 [Tanacetum coccineum]
MEQRFCNTVEASKVLKLTRPGWVSYDYGERLTNHPYDRLCTKEVKEKASTKCPQLAQEALAPIHPDDIKEMIFEDGKWHVEL